MMAREFKIGDVVELRSGGPAMTVMGNDDDEPPRFICSYFTDGKLTTLGFESAVLAMSPDKAPSQGLGGMIDTQQSGMIDGSRPS